MGVPPTLNEMTHYTIYEYDTATNKSIPISGHISSLGHAYDLVQGDKEAGQCHIIRFPDEVCVWPTTAKMTKDEKSELAEHMCDLAKYLLTRLYECKPEYATVDWIDPIVRDTVTAQFPDCHVHPYKKYVYIATQMYYTLEHIFNEFIALNSYDLYYHKIASYKMHFVETVTRRDPLNPLIKNEQYMAVFKQRKDVYRYFVTRGAGPVEIIPVDVYDVPAVPFNEKLSNIVNVVMASVDHPTFPEEWV